MFRNATMEDVAFIFNLESTLFDEDTRMSRPSIIHSIKSTNQKVIILEDQGKSYGTMIYMQFSKSFRLYSLAIHPDAQGLGYGKKCMNYLIKEAEKYQKNILLEVREDSPKLVSFYKTFGFTVSHTLIDYYGKNKHGLKMIRRYKTDTNTNNLIIIEKPIQWLPTEINGEIIYAHEYMTSEKYSDFKGRIFNLCDSYKYQSIGYYVSLLAVARDTKVIPSITTINDFKNKTILRSITDDIDELIQTELADTTFEKFTIRIYFGRTQDKKFAKLAHELFLLLETPFLEVEFSKFNKWMINKAISFSKSLILEKDYTFVTEAARKYFSLKRFKNPKLKNYIYDLAILVDPLEETPPSDKEALKLFEKMAQEIGFYVEFITKKDYRRLTEFDALFIRETTSVNNHTYDFARYAYSEGLALIDDPWSILKCSNKVFLYERMKKHNVPMPETFVITHNNVSNYISMNHTFPLILKQPDSAFSKGVFKVENQKEFQQKAKNLLKTSQLIIAQEFMESDFDWRIGILNNKPIFACKYYMANGHWQIMDWNQSIVQDGNSSTHHLEEVPQNVIEIAITASSLIGNALYGVDIKEINGQAYLIEINDNPNIDYGIEDAILNKDLYRQIIQEIYDRIDMERNIIRYI